MDEFVKCVTLIANIFTIVASGIAIYIFCTKRGEVKSVFELLINYTYQLSLSEIKEKIERLNEYNVNDPEQRDEVINIFHEIIGQLRGNETLNIHFSKMITRMEGFASDKRKLTEARRRSIVAELRERLRHLNVKNIDNLVGDKK